MKDRIVNYLKAGYPGLYIVSHEESRVESLLKDSIDALNETAGDEPFKLTTWSCTEGLLEVTNPEAERISCEEPMEMLTKLLEADKKTIYLVYDFHLFTEDKNPLIWRKVKDVLANNKANNKALIILGCRFTLPPELEKEMIMLDFALPDREQLRSTLHTLVGANRHAMKSLETNEASILAAASGLTTTEAENAFALSIVEVGKVTPEIVFREKCQAVRKSGILDIDDSDVKLDDVGGLEALKHWLLERRDAFSDDAREFGLPSPKGFIGVGQPGTGKTLMAKACRNIFKIPLLRLEAGKLFGSLVGQSESNWRMVFELAKAMAPCILFVDELDGLTSGGASSGQTDGGTTQRVIKTMLQDIEEKSEGIFFIGTANDVDAIPSALLSRMDAVWNVDLPNPVEREAVWSIQLRKIKRNPAKFDLAKLVAKSEGFSGREIKKVAEDTLFSVYADSRREPATDDVVRTLESFVPVSVLKAKETEERRKRLVGVAKLASGAAQPKQAAKGTRNVIAKLSGSN